MLAVNDNCVRRDVGYLENVKLGTDGAGTLSVTAGTVWLTHGDGRDDVVLTAGESVRFEPNTCAIASALGGPADVMICMTNVRQMQRAA